NSMSRPHRVTTLPLASNREGICSDDMLAARGTSGRPGTSVPAKCRYVSRLPAKAHLGLSGKTRPQRLELRGIGRQQRGVIDHQKIFLVAGGGAACPVEAAIEQQAAIEQRELVVHVVGAVINTQWHALALQPLDIAALVELF